MSTVAEYAPEYEEFKTKWEKCRDAVRGEDVIKAKGDVYLPKLSGQDKEDYRKYKKQGLFYEATPRTHSAFKGMLFRKDPDVNADGLDALLEDCDLKGCDIIEYASKRTDEELKTARWGILVEHPRVDNPDITIAQAERENIRPYFVSFAAEDIRFVKHGRIGNKYMLTQVRLTENVKVEGEDEFSQVNIEQIRVLDLEYREAGMPVYRQRVFREDEESKWMEVEELRRYPLMGGVNINEIPFYMPENGEWREPPLMGLVNVNLSHYVAYADHRRGVAFTTRPQPYGTGIKSDDLPDPMVLGGGSFWNFPDADSKIGMLEYSGSGLSASEKVLDDLKQDMAVLGARMILDNSDGAETATEFVIKKQGESSSLADISDTVSRCITKALQFAGKWVGISNYKEIQFQISKDFVPVEMGADDMVKMWTLVQAGSPFTERDYLYNLKQGERLDPTIEDDERISESQTEPPEGLE